MKADQMAKRDSKERKETAYHEASHAVMAIERGRRFKRVHIITDERRSGGLEFTKPSWVGLDPDEMTPRQLTSYENQLVRDAIVLLTGPCLTFKLTKQWDMFGSMSDLSNAQWSLSRIMPIMAVPIAINQMMTEIQGWLDGALNWKRIVNTGNELLERETLSYHEARAIYLSSK